MIEAYDNIPVLKKHVSTFYKCSKYCNGISKEFKYMNVPDVTCVNFDEVTNDLSLQYGGKIISAASADSFCLVKKQPEGYPVLVEFKSGKVNDKTAKNVREKMCNSILTLEAIFNKKWTELRKSLIFILVYNKENNNNRESSNPKQFMDDHLNNKANGSTILFGLRRYNKIYYKQVLTLTEEQFTDLCAKWK